MDEMRRGMYAGRGPRGYRHSDERIREDVNERLTDDWRVDAIDIEVSVDNGVVTLAGRVGSRAEKRRAEDIAESVARLPPDELARFRRWFAAFEAGRTDHASELDSTATKLGRFAGRALAELKKRTKDREP